MQRGYRGRRTRRCQRPGMDGSAAGDPRHVQQHHRTEDQRLASVEGQQACRRCGPDIPGPRPGCCDRQAHRHDRAPRLDDLPDCRDDAGIADAVRQIAARWTDQCARAAFGCCVARWRPPVAGFPPTGPVSAWSVLIGLRERATWNRRCCWDFLAERHLSVFGARIPARPIYWHPLSKTSPAATPPTRCGFLIVDLKGSRLRDVVPDGYLLRWTDGSGMTRNGLALNGPDLEVAAVRAVAAAMGSPHANGRSHAENSAAPDRGGWPEVFIVVDDFAMVNNAARRPSPRLHGSGAAPIWLACTRWSPARSPSPTGDHSCRLADETQHRRQRRHAGLGRRQRQRPVHRWRPCHPAAAGPRCAGQLRRAGNRPNPVVPEIETGRAPRPTEGPCSKEPAPPSRIHRGGGKPQPDCSPGSRFCGEDHVSTCGKSCYGVLPVGGFIAAPV